MSKVRVLLKQDIKGLGRAGEVVEVKEGYATNFLLAHDKAAIYSEAIAKKLAKESVDREARERRELEEAESKKKLIDGHKLILQAKSKEGKLFGAIGHKDIADAIGSQFGVEIDKKKIISPIIKSLGSYEAAVKLHNKVSAKIEVIIV